MRGKLGLRSQNILAPSLFLNFNAANNSTTFVDSSGNDFTVTPSGDVKISSGEFKYGGSSGYFFGSDGYLETETDDAFDLFTAGEVTLESWIYPSGMGEGSNGIAGWNTFSFDQRTALLVSSSEEGLALSVSRIGVNNISTAAGVITENQWHHVAVVREYDEDTESYITKLYVDGIEEASGYTNVWENANNDFLRIGYLHPDNGYRWSGYIDDFRFSRTAVYRSAFTPPGGFVAGGSSWTARSAAEANAWNSVTYGDGLFVAVSSSGTNRVMTSPDGATWTARSAAEANLWESVTYGDGLFVAVSQDGTNRVMTSPDGTSWTARSAAQANAWRSVAYGDGLFVAVSSSGTNRVMTSPDGINWTSRSAAEANSWLGVTYGGGLFVAVSSSGTNRVMTSPDGINWTARSAAEENFWNSVVYGDGLFVAVSTDGINRVMTSPNGITWTAKPAAEANSWRSVAYGNGLFAAVSNFGSNLVMTAT